MKRIILISTLFMSLLIVIACNKPNSQNVSKQKSIDYSNQKDLVELIKATPNSKDTLFLGFTTGMTKSEFKKHIQKLRKEGKTIDFSDSNRASLMGNTIELGAGYIFKTSLSIEKSKETLRGKGQYILQPTYNDGKLAVLNITIFEDWENTYNEPNWLENKVIENSEEYQNAALTQVLIKNKMVDENDNIRKKNNLIIQVGTLNIKYMDKKTLLTELLIKQT
ncbi:MAG TPA: hypothetical protein VN182_07745, partial [Flavobacterium sp.]|nr:hypothetical protein [Flavobacterium sp.]